MAPAATDRVIVPPTIGVSAEVGNLLDQMTVDPNQLVTINLDNCDVMIEGFDFDAGGETRETTDPDGTKREFITPPQIIMQLKVEDIEGLNDTKQYFPVKLKADGTIADASAGSQYGMWLSVMSGLGVSGDADIGVRYNMKGLRDLCGLRFHREMQQFDGFRDRKQKVAVPTILYGFDNEFRATLGLAPAELAA